MRLVDLSAPASRERLRWAVRVRWLVIFGFFALAAAAWAMGDMRSLRPCVGAAIAATALNAIYHVAVARWWRVLGASILAEACDILLITYVVLHTGGAQSPFAMMYVVQVLASAMLVSFGAAALGAVLSVLCVTASLLLQRLGVLGVESSLSIGGSSYPLLWGFFLLYCLTLLAYVGGYVGEQLRRREGDLEAANRDLARSVRSLEQAHGELRDTVDQLRAAERQLVQSEKMRALGQFVAGVAHELNNPIAVVAANVEHLREMLPGLCAGGSLESGEDLPALLDDCREAARRAAAIVADLRKFSRGEDPGLWGEFDLDASVAQALALLRHLTKPGVVLVPRCGGVPRMSGFAGQLDQVLLNLITNAIQAVGERGRVEISTRVEVQSPPGMARGPVAVVEVVDDGVGMTPDVLAKLFEPFFTTKAEGEGTGLGLSVSHGIVERHGGALRVWSRPGQGSTFALYLPIEPVGPGQRRESVDLA